MFWLLVQRGLSFRNGSAAKVDIYCHLQVKGQTSIQSNVNMGDPQKLEMCVSV